MISFPFFICCIFSRAGVRCTSISILLPPSSGNTPALQSIPPYMQINDKLKEEPGPSSRWKPGVCYAVCVAGREWASFKSI